MKLTLAHVDSNNLWAMIFIVLFTAYLHKRSAELLYIWLRINPAAEVFFRALRLHLQDQALAPKLDDLRWIVVVVTVSSPCRPDANVD